MFAFFWEIRIYTGHVDAHRLSNMSRVFFLGEAPKWHWGLSPKYCPWRRVFTRTGRLMCGRGWRRRYSDWLWSGLSGDRIQMGEGFSSLVQTDHGAYPTSCTVGTGSLPGLKRPGRHVVHPPLSSTEVIQRVELHIYSPTLRSWQVITWTSRFIF